MNAPQIRAKFNSISFRSHTEMFMDLVKREFKKKGLFMQMLKDAYPDISEDTLKDLYDLSVFQVDHVVGHILDDPENFFYMFFSLNNQFDRNTEEQFKKEHTGAGWQGAIELTENALAMQLRFGRL